MSNYEYKTVAAPRRAPRVKGVKGKEALAARAIEDIISAECGGGWEYLRADSFDFEEANGIFGGKHTVTRSIMVFRRQIAPAAAATPTPAPAQATAPLSAQQPVVDEGPAIGGVDRS